MIIDKYFSNMMDTKELRVQTAEDGQVMFLTQEHYIFLEREQAEGVRDFLTKFLDGELSKSDDEWVPNSDGVNA